MIKIMVVDDEIAMREILKIMLKDYRVIEASNGKEAIKLYKEEKPDIVLMDIMMPIMNGIEATSEIKRIDPQAKIVAITAYASSKGEKVVKAGADYILKKPFTRRDVVKVIQNILNTS
jgi:CheY-like chemotaxis protein